MARAVRARSDESVGPRVRANEPPDEHASEGAPTPAPSLSALGPRELRVRAARGGERAAGRGAALRQETRAGWGSGLGTRCSREAPASGTPGPERRGRRERGETPALLRSSPGVRPAQPARRGAELLGLRSATNGGSSRDKRYVCCPQLGTTLCFSFPQAAYTESPANLF
ncbi:UDP-GalNAc:beta-1,3-N-acetylgalactosaminyltransferase 1 isoform X3 [Saccopteryx leptura]|uniref:UDP-GalNAc:beta-1, 3-N-acetylgalactosaminyltransferase 1 isoform X3 n=2 Tax=Saccopteryx leptura TaxID=249018 RepID=UPI00339C5E06